MMFWDSSALVPLLVEEPASAKAQDWLDEDPGIVAWWGTPTECWSALARLRREEILTVTGESQAHGVLDVVRSAWLEILPTDAVHERARRLLRTHPLRAADALQLAAALVWADDVAGHRIVTFDERLALAAELEGFLVVS